MIAVQTEHEKVMTDIMSFTGIVVKITDMLDVPVSLRAQAIFEAEKVLHKVIMDRMVAKCAKQAEPCRN